MEQLPSWLPIGPPASSRAELAYLILFRHYSPSLADRWLKTVD